MTKKNTTILGLNPVHLVRMVPDWVDCCVVMLSSDESCDSDRGSLELPKVIIGESYTRECTVNANIFSIAKISAESWIYPMFVDLAGIGDSSSCNLNQRGSSRNIFDFNLEPSWCDSNLHNFCAQLLKFKIVIALSIFEIFFDSKVFH